MELRHYQQAAIQSLRANIKNRIKSQILCAPTGAGKSIIALELIRMSLEKGSRMLFLVDRRVLVNQFSKHLDSIEIPHGVIMSKHPKYAPGAQVQVASCQTLEKWESIPLFDIVIYDECHVNRAIIKKIKKTGAVLIGLTATPLTKGLSGVYDALVNVTTMANLVKEKFLVPYKVFIANEVDTSSIKVSRNGEYNPGKLEESALKIIGDVVSDWLQISQSVWGETKKTIVFSAGVKHGEELAKAFCAVGKHFVDLNYLHDEEYKQKVIEEFSKPDSCIDGLVSCGILTRGFDVCDVGHVVLAKPLRKSISEHIQQIGRGARIAEGKEFCVIQCNSGNYLRFREDFDDIFQNGVEKLQDGGEKPRPAATKKQKKEATCPKCRALWPAGGTSCLHCGHVMDKKPISVETVDGVISELHGVAMPKKPKDKLTIYQELLGYARRQGYKDGWAYHKFIEKYNEKPPRSYIPKEPSPETIALVRHLAIKKSYRKRMAA